MRADEVTIAMRRALWRLAEGWTITQAYEAHTMPWWHDPKSEWPERCHFSTFKALRDRGMITILMASDVATRWAISRLGEQTLKAAAFNRKVRT